MVMTNCGLSLPLWWMIFVDALSEIGFSPSLSSSCSTIGKKHTPYLALAGSVQSINSTAALSLIDAGAYICGGLAGLLLKLL